MRVELAEDADGLPRDVRRAPEVRLEDRPRGLVRDGLDLADRRVACVVRDNVDAPKLRVCRRERRDDVCLLGDVELEREEAFGGVGSDEVSEDLWSACGRDCGVAMLEDDLCELAAEAR